MNFRGRRGSNNKQNSVGVHDRNGGGGGGATRNISVSSYSQTRPPEKVESTFFFLFCEGMQNLTWSPARGERVKKSDVGIITTPPPPLLPIHSDKRGRDSEVRAGD